MNNQYAQNNQQQAQFFNLHLNAVGYINGFKWNSEGGFAIIEFCGLEGPSEKPEYRFFSLVMTEAVAEIIGQYAQAIMAEAKVFASLRIAKWEPKPFIYPEGHQLAGQLGVSNFGTVINLQSLTINGQRVYEGQKRNNNQGNRRQGGNYQGRGQGQGGRGNYQGGGYSRQAGQPGGYQPQPQNPAPQGQGFQQPPAREQGFQQPAAHQPPVAPHQGAQGGYSQPAPMAPSAGVPAGYTPAPQQQAAPVPPAACAMPMASGYGAYKPHH